MESPSTVPLSKKLTFIESDCTLIVVMTDRLLIRNFSAIDAKTGLVAKLSSSCLVIWLQSFFVVDQKVFL